VSRVTVRIENWYEDGHESKYEVLVDPPAALDEDGLDAWWNDVVFKHTGDGHGINGMHSVYTATVLACDDPELLGESTEWVD